MLYNLLIKDMAYNIQEIPVEDLSVYVNNSRTHSTEQVKQISNSIKEFGFTNPLLIDKNKEIIAGHGRLMAAKQLGLDKVPCIELSNLSEKQKKAYVIADNQLALNAGWNESILSMEIGDLSDNNFDISLLGFNDLDLNKYLLKEFEGLTDEDEVPEPPKEPITKLGDIWQLGNHRVMCGDSTKEEDIKKLCINPVDLLLTDPPYNIDYEGGSKKRDKIANDKIDNFREFLIKCFSNAGSVMKAGASYYIWYADTESYNVRGSVMDVGWTIRQNLIWNKDNSTFGRSDYHWKHEPCLYGWIDGASHNWMGDRKQTTVIEFKRPSKSKLHSTMKPVGLMEYQITNNTKGKDIVLDLFGGSGSTLIACEKLDRICNTIEFDPKYCDVIVKRWENFTGKKAKLIKDNHATT
jgi:DNA modification methylase